MIVGLNRCNYELNCNFLIILNGNNKVYVIIIIKFNELLLLGIRFFRLFICLDIYYM